MTKKALSRSSTEELENALYSDTLDRVQKRQAEQILRERERAPDRKRGVFMMSQRGHSPSR